MRPDPLFPPGTLVLCGAPIGDVGDASPRLRAVLESADVVAAEDTRRVRRLAVHLDTRITGRVVSYYDAVEAARASELVDTLRAGSTVAVITDAGMPGVSDPGYRLVAAAVAAGCRVTAIPGPSAVTTALAVSGLPTDRWVFEGFLPRRPGERRARVAALAAEPRTLVLLEAPHRAAAMLADLATAFGADRRAVACRELAKTYEEIVHSDVAGLREWAERGLRGELTIVVAGAPAAVPAAVDAGRLAAAVAARELAGAARRDAIREVAAELGLAKRVVYDAVLQARSAERDGG